MTRIKDMRSVQQSHDIKAWLAVRRSAIFALVPNKVASHFVSAQDDEA